MRRFAAGLIATFVMAISLVATPPAGAYGKETSSGLLLTKCRPGQVFALTTATGTANPVVEGSPYRVQAFGFDPGANPQYFSQVFRFDGHGDAFVDKHYLYVTLGPAMGQTPVNVGPPSPADVVGSGTLWGVIVSGFPAHPPFTPNLVVNGDCEDSFS